MEGGEWGEVGGGGGGEGGGVFCCFCFDCFLGRHISSLVGMVRITYVYTDTVFGFNG